jgi:hypothetical protein
LPCHLTSRLGVTAGDRVYLNRTGGGRSVCRQLLRSKVVAKRSQIHSQRRRTKEHHQAQGDENQAGPSIVWE